MACKWMVLAFTTMTLCLGVMSSSVYYVDTPSSSFLRDNIDLDTVSKQLYEALPSALLGLRPSASISSELSQQLNSIIKPQPFKQPKMFVSVNVLGEPTDMLDTLKASFQGSKVQKLDSSKLSTLSLLNALATCGANNKALKLTTVGATHLQSSASDLEKEIKQLANALGTSFSAGTLQLSDSDVLDCTVEEEKAVAADIATLYNKLTAVLADAALTQDQQAVELTVSSLHGLAIKYGSSSTKYSAALEAVFTMISAALQKHQAVAGSTVVQVAAVPLSGDESATTLLNLSQRTLQQEVVAIEEEGAQDEDASMERSKMFSIKAAAYGSFILLMYFTFAGIYCMCTMKFKQDSLLYPRTKSE